MLDIKIPSHLDPRAVRDDLKGLSVEEIKAIIDPLRLNFSLLMENDIKDISRGGLVRTLNGFSGQRCIIYGDKKRFDRRSCVGSYIYEHFDYAKNIDELRSILRPNSKLIAVELTDKSTSIYDYKFDFDVESILLMGHESSDGLAEELREVADDFIAIPTTGTIRSLNITSAFSIVAYEYARQFHHTISELKVVQ